MSNRLRSTTHVTPAPATLAKLKPLFRRHVKRTNGHWVWQGKVSRGWPCLFTRQGTWGAAKAFWIYAGGVLLNGRRLWRKETCREPLCVAPHHHTTTAAAFGSLRATLGYVATAGVSPRRGRLLAALTAHVY